MNPTYEFDRKFRLKILALMLDNMWMARLGSSIIQPEYFEQDDEEAIAKAIIQYRESYNKSPTDVDDISELAGQEYSEVIEAIVDGKSWWSLELASDKAIAFAREQAAKIAIIDSVSDIEKGDLHTPVERIQKVMEIGTNVLSPGIDPIKDAGAWLYEMWENKVRTGWGDVDNILDGGLDAGELGLILAPPNAGKTMSLINLGYNAASILSRLNVVHFTHEMKANKIAKRYAARMLFKFPSKDGSLSEYEDELYAAARMLMPGKIRIIDTANTTQDIESQMSQLVAEGFNPGLIIDDYPDLIVPPRRYGERRFELSATYTWLRELGAKYNCPVWAASQANRGAMSKEIITMADVAEDIGKAAIADVIVALCQTYEESQAEQCRLFMAKVRDGNKKAIIAAKYYGYCQAIITTGIIKRKEARDV